MSSFDLYLERRLKNLRLKDRYRRLLPRGGVDLSSNDYLALSDHPRVRTAMAEALQQGIPLGASGSRLLRGNTHWHSDLEASLAAFAGTEAALVFNSGYDANVGVISTLCGSGDVIFSDALIHASMIDGIRASKAGKAIFAHNDMVELERLLRETPCSRHRFIAVESVYSMDGDRAPLRELALLAERYQAQLIVDEAHATGVFGARGQGLCSEAGVQPLVAIHTCGKAWGSFGAFAVCTRTVKDYLINYARRFIFTTALPPLLMVQWRAVLTVLKEERDRADRVLALAGRFRAALQGVAGTGHSDTQIVPVICGSSREAMAAAAACQRAGFDVRAIRPPTVPSGTSRLRISFHAGLTEQEVDRLAAVIAAYFQTQSKENSP